MYGGHSGKNFNEPNLRKVILIAIDILASSTDCKTSSLRSLAYPLVIHDIREYRIFSKSCRGDIMMMMMILFYASLARL